MERSASQRLTRILLAEDNLHDVRLIRYALQQEQDWLTEVVVAENGEKAIHYLIEQVSSANATKPDLVILDLNLPKMDGTEVLQVIRTTEGLHSLPVVIVRRVLMQTQNSLRVDGHDRPDERSEGGTGSLQGKGVSTGDQVGSARQGGLAMRQRSDHPLCLLVA
jgi:CheY-like chemotaxis protein